MPGRLKLGLSILAVLVVIIAIGEWSSSDPTDIAPKATPAPSHTTQSVREEAAPSLQAAEVFDSSVVARHLGGNKLGIVATDLMTKKTPRARTSSSMYPRHVSAGSSASCCGLCLMTARTH
jgi:hypothetical protein